MKSPVSFRCMLQSVCLRVNARTRRDVGGKDPWWRCLLWCQPGSCSMCVMEMDASKVVWVYSCLVPWSWTSSKHSEVVVNKEGIWLKLLTPVDSCCLSMLLVARAIATYVHIVFDSARTIVEDLSVQLIKCYKGRVYINIQDKATSVMILANACMM